MLTAELSSVLVVAAAAPDPSGVSWGNIALGIGVPAVTALGLVVVEVIRRKSRGPQDVRDDQTVKTATATAAAEVAMQMVETTKTWADHLQAASQKEIGRLNERVKALEAEIESLRLQLARGAGDLATAAAREQRLARERDDALATVADLQSFIDDHEAQKQDLTLRPEAVQRARDRALDEEDSA